MARYIGPKTKIARKFGDPIYGPDKYFEKKNYPPGHHGANKRRRKTSEYGIQLKEKQKAKYTYGVLERQFAKLFDKALDNVVFRLGIAPTRNGARQLISHKHITVNGKVSNIPSFLLKAGDIVGVREKSKSLEVVLNSLETVRYSHSSWLEWDQDQLAGKFLNVPEREDIPENIKEQLIVELYSK
jgi:small subunit ribosomal protein S4